MSVSKEEFKYNIVKQFRDIDSPIRLLMLLENMKMRKDSTVYWDSLELEADDYGLNICVELIPPETEEADTQFQVRFSERDVNLPYRMGWPITLEEYYGTIRYHQETVRFVENRIEFYLHAFDMDMDDNCIFHKFSEDVVYSIIFDCKTLDFIRAYQVNTALELWASVRNREEIGYIDYVHNEEMDSRLFTFISLAPIASKDRNAIYCAFQAARAEGVYEGMSVIVRELLRAFPSKD